MPDDRQIAVSEAERLLGRRVDRRRKYALIDGGVCEFTAFTTACSGCDEGYEYGGNGTRGAGCFECGFTGRRRVEIWTPVCHADAYRDAAIA